MTIDTKNLRVLAHDCKQREIDFDDVSPNQCSTSLDKLTRAYITACSPGVVTELLNALERKDRLLRGCIGIMNSGPYVDAVLVRGAIEAITKEIGT